MTVQNELISPVEIVGATVEVRMISTVCPAWAAVAVNVYVFVVHDVPAAGKFGMATAPAMVPVVLLKTCGVNEPVLPVP